MHKFALDCFNITKNIFTLMKILILFFIMILLLYWVEQLIGANWLWLEIFRPMLAVVLGIASNINNTKFNIFGTVFEFQYIIACILLIACFYIMNLCIFITGALETSYNATRNFCKRTEEKIVNNQLKHNIKKQESKISKYDITIQTKIKTKLATQIMNVNLKEQNSLLKNYLESRLCTKGQTFENGLIFHFDKFDDIDNVLDIFFKALNSKAPLDYAICVQVDENADNIKNLYKLSLWGKVIMSADTKFRYSFNKNKRYEITQHGLFQFGDNTVEVSEFKVSS